MPSITKYDERELSGGLPEGQKGLYDIDMDAFESVLKINTMGTVIPTMEFAKQMIKKGGGSVINFASMNSYCPLTRCFAYAMSKAAVSNLTQSFAAYYAPANIRINAIAPGFIATDMTENIGEDNPLRTMIPLGKMGKPEDIASAAAFLCSEGAAYITGEVRRVDGGLAM